MQQLSHCLGLGSLIRVPGFVSQLHFRFLFPINVLPKKTQKMA